MDDTAVCSNFSTRSNAKRAAEKMIGDGTAPAVDYRIKPRDDGRFEIEWKTNPAPATEAVEAEITTASGEGVPVSMAAHRDESVEGIFEKNPASVSGAEANTGGGAPETAGTTESTESAKRSPAELTEDPFPADTWVKVRQGKRKVIIGQVRQRVDPRTWRVHQFGKPEDWTILATAAQLCHTEPAPEAPKSARRSRRRAAAEPAKASRSQYAISADMIAAGKLPEKPRWSPQRPTRTTKSISTGCSGSPKPAIGTRCATTRSRAATAIQKWSRATARICWRCTSLRRPPNERARSTGALAGLVAPQNRDTPALAFPLHDAGSTVTFD